VLGWEHRHNPPKQKQSKINKHTSLAVCLLLGLSLRERQRDREKEIVSKMSSFNPGPEPSVGHVVSYIERII